MPALQGNGGRCMSSGSAHIFVPRSMHDATFAQLDPNTQRLEYYARMCPGRASEGLFRFPFGYLFADIGMPIEEAKAAMDELTERRPFRFDWDNEILLDCEALKHNPIRHKRDDFTKEIEINEKTGEPKKDRRTKGAIGRLKALPETPLLAHLLDVALDHSPDFAQDIREAFPHLQAPSQAPSLGAVAGPTQGANRSEPNRLDQTRTESHRSEGDKTPPEVQEELARVNAEW